MQRSVCLLGLMELGYIQLQHRLEVLLKRGSVYQSLQESSVHDEKTALRADLLDSVKKSLSKSTSPGSTLLQSPEAGSGFVL